MERYTRLPQLAAGMTPRNAETVLGASVIPYLVDVWIEDYERSAKDADIVETTSSDFSYLFDIAAGRLIAAWGVSRGRDASPRPNARMKGHPLGAGPHYHRGHAIPHTLGGPTDINLVPQRGSVNVGPFRELERKAVATPGSFYFTHWHYEGPTSQTPVSVDQGLLVPGQKPELRTHSN